MTDRKICLMLMLMVWCYCTSKRWRDNKSLVTFWCDIKFVIVPFVGWFLSIVIFNYSIPNDKTFRKGKKLSLFTQDTGAYETMRHGDRICDTCKVNRVFEKNHKSESINKLEIIQSSVISVVPFCSRKRIYAKMFQGVLVCVMCAVRNDNTLW